MSEPIELFEKLECNDTEIIETARAEIYNILLCGNYYNFYWIL